MTTIAALRSCLDRLSGLESLLLRPKVPETPPRRRKRQRRDAADKQDAPIPKTTPLSERRKAETRAAAAAALDSWNDLASPRSPLSLSDSLEEEEEEEEEKAAKDFRAPPGRPVFRSQREGRGGFFVCAYPGCREFCVYGPGLRPGDQLKLCVNHLETVHPCPVCVTRRAPVTGWIGTPGSPYCTSCHGD
jgi:hypothetical protein